MTSVLPAWKLELIEKKKKKGQDERQKLEEERSRKVSIPEWKKNLLEKKKESASDSPETREQALNVNSVFGPRILRKTSEKTLAIANASQRPATKVGNEEISKRKVLVENTTRNRASALYSSPADSNSCVTKGVEIPTEGEHVHKSNKLGSLKREVGYYRESPRRSDGALSKEDNFSVTTDVQSAKTKVDNEHVQVPSVVSYRRMFEQSKPESNKDISESWIVKSSESLKADAKSDKRTTESKLVTANDESRLQILNKTARDNAQSIHLEESSLHTSETNQRKIASPPPSVTPKPYKSFVSTPPWLKNTKPKTVTFSTGERKSVQETMVAKVNSEVENASKDFHKSDQKSIVIVESDVQEKEKKTLNHSDLVNIPASTSEAVREKPVEPDTKKRDLQLPQSDQTLQKYSIVTQSDVKEEPIAVKSGNESRNQKYLVISSRNQQESTPLNEKAVTVISTDSLSQVSNELVLHCHKDNQEGSKRTLSRQSSIESLRSMFGPSVGLRRRTSSEDNLALNVNQSEPIEHGSVLRRPGQNKRQPAMVRWSADVLSLMSQPIDDDDDLSMLSPRSDSMIPSANSSQAKRPPPPQKRWTADVLSVMSQPADNDTSILSPRSDCSKRSSPSNSLDRTRSSSLSDIREEQGIDFFQHKPNVSHGIEHRMHKLIRKVSISDISINAEGGDSDSVSDDESAGLSDVELFKEVPNAQEALKEEITDHAFIDAAERKDSPPPVFAQEQEIQPVFARKHSISHDIEHRVTELFHRQLSQQSDGGESEGEESWESDGKVSNDLVHVVEKVQESVPEKLKTEPATVVSIEKSTDFVLPSTKDEPNEDSDHVVAENKPSKGSVHKLSALFGSSIWKPNKKDKSSREEKPKEKANVGSKPQKIPSTEKSNIKESVVKKEDGKKSSLFSKSQKIEEKSAKKKQEAPSNTNMFPWLKKRDKEEEKTGGNKTMGVDDKNQRNSSSSSTDEGADTVSFAARGLRPVRKAEKVEQRLVGKLMIISNASHEKTPPKGVYHKTKPSFQLPEQEKEKRSAKEMHDTKPADSERNEAQIPAIVTQHWNGNLKSQESEKSTNESVPITSIDEVPVSAIDMPESGDSDVTVIDVPASPDVRSAEKFVFLNGNTEEATQASDDVSVSVIDLPSHVAKEDAPNTFQGGYLDADELSDGSDMDEVEGSYDFATGEITHLVNGDIASDDDEDEEDDEDDDDDDVPISYIGSAPRYPVPQVVFDSEPVQLKSCLSPKIERKKMKRGKVSFKSSHTIHDYPSEETVTAAYDEVKTNNNMQLKTLQNYQPAGLVNMEKKPGHTGGNPPVQVTQPVSNGERRVHDMASNGSHPEIKYADEGQGFTDSTDYASALLF